MLVASEGIPGRLTVGLYSARWLFMMLSDPRRPALKPIAVPASHASEEVLCSREVETPPVMALGGSNRQISSTLLQRLKSVRALVRSIRRKLSVGDRQHAVTNPRRRCFSEALPPCGLLTALDP